MSDHTPRDKAELLRRIAQGWEALENAIGQLSPDQLTRPGRDGGWPVKEHLAHLAAWERSALAALQCQPRHLALGVDQATYDTGDDERINAVIEQNNRARPLAEVLADLRETHRQMLKALEGLGFAALLAEHEGARQLDRVIGNTYEHYEEHLPWMAALLKSQA